MKHRVRKGDVSYSKQDFPPDIAKEWNYSRISPGTVNWTQSNSIELTQKIVQSNSIERSIFELMILTRELRARVRASCRYDVENGTRSLARSIGRFL